MNACVEIGLHVSKERGVKMELLYNVAEFPPPSRYQKLMSKVTGTRSGLLRLEILAREFSSMLPPSNTRGYFYTLGYPQNLIIRLYCWSIISLTHWTWWNQAATHLENWPILVSLLSAGRFHAYILPEEKSNHSFYPVITVLARTYPLVQQEEKYHKTQILSNRI